MPAPPVSSQGDSITVGNSLNTTSNDYNLLALGDGNNDTATLYYGSNNEMFAGNGNFDTLSMMSGNNNVMLIGNGTRRYDVWSRWHRQHRRRRLWAPIR